MLPSAKMRVGRRAMRTTRLPPAAGEGGGEEAGRSVHDGCELQGLISAAGRAQGRGRRRRTFGCVAAAAQQAGCEAPRLVQHAHDCSDAFQVLSQPKLGTTAPLAALLHQRTSGRAHKCWRCELGASAPPRLPRSTGEPAAALVRPLGATPCAVGRRLAGTPTMPAALLWGHIAGRAAAAAAAGWRHMRAPAPPSNCSAA